MSNLFEMQHNMIPAVRFGMVLLAGSLTNVLVAPACGAEFAFGGDRNGIAGQSATVTSDGVALTLTAGPNGAELSERSTSGLGVNSRTVPGVEPLDDAGPTGSTIDLNLIGGTSQFAGQGESISFSFDQAGLITELDFSGVKDEEYEFILLQTPGETDIYFFDGFIGSSADPDLIDVPGEVIFLLEVVGSNDIDDVSPPLAIPFTAGQTFTLTYGQLDVGDVGNGLRWQGVTISTVPEPTAASLLLAVALFIGRGRRGIRDAL